MSTVETQTVEWLPPSPEVAATEAGMMARRLLRQLPDGTAIQFEEAPLGWLTKAGDPRKVPWRAYFHVVEGRRNQLPSTTRILDLVCPKGGLPHWAEARGIEGVIVAIQEGKLDPHSITPGDAIERVRQLGLGAEAAKRRAADRGLNVHAVLEKYMLTGEAPRLADHPEHHRGFLVGLTNWLLEADPEPIAVEQLVACIEDRYAGRLDLRARIGGLLTTVDLKTQENAAIYPQAHYQVAMYERAAVACGEEPADQKIVVVVAADGKHRVMPADHEDWRVDAALQHWRAKRPIESACESANRAEKAARVPA